MVQILRFCIGMREDRFFVFIGLQAKQSDILFRPDCRIFTTSQIAAKGLTSKHDKIRSQTARPDGGEGSCKREWRPLVDLLKQIFVARHGTSLRSQLGMAGRRMQASIPVEIVVSEGYVTRMESARIPSAREWRASKFVAYAAEIYVIVPV